jgi:hypothetical protein
MTKAIADKKHAPKPIKDNALNRPWSGLATNKTPMSPSFFYAIANLKLSNAMVFSYSSPIFIPLIAWLFLKIKDNALNRPWSGLATNKTPMSPITAAKIIDLVILHCRASRYVWFFLCHCELKTIERHGF